MARTPVLSLPHSNCTHTKKKAFKVYQETKTKSMKQVIKLPFNVKGPILASAFGRSIRPPTALESVSFLQIVQPLFINK